MVQHQNLRPIDPKISVDASFPGETIVAVLKEILLPNKTSLLKPGQLLKIMSPPYSPRAGYELSGQSSLGLKTGCYDVVQVRKVVKKLTVMNSANLMVLHSKLRSEK
ncbi:hypothetical protein C0991_012233 [Blastosporella zonata]|nr:hypothetical protein C0991_012233 [Blastosporella zonata]